MFGDILRRMVTQMTGECLMYVSNYFRDYVFSLSKEDFKSLYDACLYRKNKERYGYASMQEAAIYYNKPIVCPRCDSKDIIKHGSSNNNLQRYLCKDCGKRFDILTDTVFNSTNLSFDTLIRYLSCMIQYPSLALIERVLDISHRTAFLWRHKIFATINDYQDHLILKDKVWIDETYIADSAIINEYGKKRGLSKNMICIVVAIDVYKNMVAIICGHGKPSSKRIEEALLSHIRSGSLVIHDGERAHRSLIKKLGSLDEVYIADTKDKTYIENMKLINSACGWLKRYIYKFIGMKQKNLQSYLNWFVYLFRVKRDNEEYPETERVLRHLLLNSAHYTRK